MSHPCCCGRASAVDPNIVNNDFMACDQNKPMINTLSKFLIPKKQCEVFFLNPTFCLGKHLKQKQHDFVPTLFLINALDDTHWVETDSTTDFVGLLVIILRILVSCG